MHVNCKSKDITVQAKNASQFLKYKASKHLLSQTNISVSNKNNNSKIGHTSNLSGSNIIKLSLNANNNSGTPINNMVSSMNIPSKHFEKLENKIKMMNAPPVLTSNDPTQPVEPTDEFEGCEILSDDFPNYDLAFKVIVIGNSGKIILN